MNMDRNVIHIHGLLGSLITMNTRTLLTIREIDKGLFTINNVSKDIIHESKIKLFNSILLSTLSSPFSMLNSNRGMISKGLMDTVYISHGSPMMAIDESIPARQFLTSWQQTVLKERPKAILVISGHWETKEPTVNVVDLNDTIYDFYNFPKPMYQIKYTPPGAPQLANRVKELLMENDFKHVHVDKKRGVDHGTWVPLMFMYPEADIPVCQLSVQTDRDGTYHYNMGKALAPLKEEGILIMGSGATTHNLGTIQPEGSPVPSWASEFDAWLKNALLEGRYEDVNHYDSRAPYGKKAHPRPDHFYPLHVAMGAAGENAKAELLHHSWGNGSLSYASYRFTAAE